MLKSKKGFTLVELCIVVAITLIIVALISGFIIAYNHRSYGIYDTSDMVADVNNMKLLTNEWLSECDMGNLSTESGVLSSNTGDKLQFDSSKKELVWKDSSGSPVKTTVFKKITSCSFEKKEGIDDIIYCKVASEKKEMWIAFDIFNMSVD